MISNVLKSENIKGDLALKFSSRIGQYESVPMVSMVRDNLMGKSRRPIEGPADARRYELPFPEKKETYKRHNKKRRQHNGDLDK